LGRPVMSQNISCNLQGTKAGEAGINIKFFASWV
jgi:hypothetical protein